MSKIQNAKIRTELIYLYSEYIKDSNDRDNYFENNANNYDMEYPQLYTKVVNIAINATWKMQENELNTEKLSIEEAKKILHDLREEEKSEKN